MNRSVAFSLKMNVTDADGEELENDKIASMETMLEKEIGDEKEKERERKKNTERESKAEKYEKEKEKSKDR